MLKQAMDFWYLAMLAKQKALTWKINDYTYSIRVPAIALPLVLLSLLSIAGCGGGGVFGPTDRHVLHLSEVSSNCNMAPAENCGDIHVVVSSDLAERPEWKASDSNGVAVFDRVDKEKLSDNTWRFTFRPATGLAPGMYTGNITLSTLNLLPITTMICLKAWHTR